MTALHLCFHMARTFLNALLIGLIMASLFGIAHAGQKGEGDDRDTLMAQKSIEEAIQICAEKVMSFHGVVGCAEGLCDDRPCIKILVSKMTPDIQDKIPAELEGYPVEIVEAGTLEALPEEEP